MSFDNTSFPSSPARSRVIDLLPQFVLTKYAATPPRVVPTPRRMSPCGGRSTLITSAPCWARIMVPYGPERLLVRSNTRTPARGPPDCCSSLLMGVRLLTAPGAIHNRRQDTPRQPRRNTLRRFLMFLCCSRPSREATGDQRPLSAGDIRRRGSVPSRCRRRRYDDRDIRGNRGSLRTVRSRPARARAAAGGSRGGDSRERSAQPRDPVGPATLGLVLHACELAADTERGGVHRERLWGEGIGRECFARRPRC